MSHATHALGRLVVLVYTFRLRLHVSLRLFRSFAAYEARVYGLFRFDELPLALAGGSGISGIPRF